MENLVESFPKKALNIKILETKFLIIISHPKSREFN